MVRARSSEATIHAQFGLPTATIRHFQFTAYADVDTYVDTYADLKYKDRVRIFLND